MKSTVRIITSLLIIAIITPIYAAEKPRLKVYYAGALFNTKDLVGNRLIADAIETLSDNRMKYILPQDLEQSRARGVINIRNNDIFAVIECDLALFNFDGDDLDSGTVAEFMLAKALDIPCVVVRTDFRNAGDQTSGGHPWNLMCSGYPRTKVILHHALALYQKHGLAESIQVIAQSVIDGFDEVMKEPTWFGSREAMVIQYRSTVQSCGSGLAEKYQGTLESVVDQKIQRGLYSSLKIAA